MKKKLPIWLMLATAFCILLVVGRCVYAGKLAFLFLVWNLFLAWIPLIISTGLRDFRHGAWLWLVPWMLFLPNAPYILTDFVHLRPRPEAIPYWYDILTLSASSITGLLIGLTSLMQVEKLFRKHVPRLIVHIFITGVCLLTGFGIYLGRYQRWNSWDVVSHPFDLLRDSFQLLLQPEPLLFTCGFGIFFLLMYRAMARLRLRA